MRQGLLVPSRWLIVRKPFKKEKGKHFLEQLKFKPSLETAHHIFKTLRGPQLMILAYGCLPKNKSNKTASKKVVGIAKTEN